MLEQRDLYSDSCSQHSCFMLHANVPWDFSSYFATTDQYAKHYVAETCILSVFLLFLSITMIHAIFIWFFLVQLQPRRVGDGQCFHKGELYELETESSHGK